MRNLSFQIYFITQAIYELKSKEEKGVEVDRSPQCLLVYLYFCRLFVCISVGCLFVFMSAVCLYFCRLFVCISVGCLVEFLSTVVCISVAVYLYFCRLFV